MPLDIGLELGVTLNIVDEPEAAAAPTQTDTAFLIHAVAGSGAPSQEVTEVRSSGEARDLYPNDPPLTAITDTFFGIGGGRMFVSPLKGTALAAAEAFVPAYGPGQLIAPTTRATADQKALRDWAWDNNHIYLASASVTGVATQAQLDTQADGLISAEGRFSSLWGDVIEMPGLAGGSTRNVDGAVVEAALIARSDIMTGNPNLAAAGNHTPGAAGQVDSAVGILADRGLDEIRSLANSQVNTFRTINNRVRAYGYWTLADLATLPQWWDLSGSRTIMAIRAREEAVAEELMFGQIAADGIFLDRYQASLAAVCAEFQRMGAIYGTDKQPGYRVDVSANPTSSLATGLVKASVIVKTSPFAAALQINLIRRAITQPV
jgi:hypothetical protein